MPYAPGVLCSLSTLPADPSFPRAGSSPAAGYSADWPSPAVLGRAPPDTPRRSPHIAKFRRTGLSGKSDPERLQDPNSRSRHDPAHAPTPAGALAHLPAADRLGLR